MLRTLTIARSLLTEFAGTIRETTNVIRDIVILVLAVSELWHVIRFLLQ
jgi:hypothetical protein